MRSILVVHPFTPVNTELISISLISSFLRAVEGEPLILRLYGSAKVIYRNDPERQGLFPLFQALPGARHIFDVRIDLVQTSCGMAVPYLSYAGERRALSEWAKKSRCSKTIWEENNSFSVDGIPTHIVAKNG